MPEATVTVLTHLGDLRYGVSQPGCSLPVAIEAAKGLASETKEFMVTLVYDGFSYAIHPNTNTSKLVDVHSGNVEERENKGKAPAAKL